MQQDPLEAISSTSQTDAESFRATAAGSAELIREQGDARLHAAQQSHRCLSQMGQLAVRLRDVVIHQKLREPPVRSWKAALNQCYRRTLDNSLPRLRLHDPATFRLLQQANAQRGRRYHKSAIHKRR